MDNSLGVPSPTGVRQIAEPSLMHSIIVAYLNFGHDIGILPFIVLNLLLVTSIIVFFVLLIIYLFRRKNRERKQKINTPKLKYSKRTVIISLAIVITTSAAISFLGGFSLSSLLSNDPIPPTVPTYPTPTSGPTDHTKNANGETYFSDTIIAITKDEPRVAIAATRSLKEEGSQIIQSSRASFFDGEWERISSSQNNDELVFEDDDVVSNWSEIQDPSRLLRFQAQANITVNDNITSIPWTQFENDISLRALPDYTKFMSQASARVNFNGQIRDAYILYTRIYTMDSGGIQFYDDSVSATTYWLAFWDNNGNFYHIDDTSVGNPNDIYQSHSIGVLAGVDGSVTRTFDIFANSDNAPEPTNFDFNLVDDINKRINVNRLNKIDKSAGTNDVWIMGTVEGSVFSDFGGSIPGIGIVEFVSN